MVSDYSKLNDSYFFIISLFINSQVRINCICHFITLNIDCPFHPDSDAHHTDEGTTLLRPDNEMSHENAVRENWDLPNNNNNSRRLLEEGGAMPIIKPAQSPLR